MATINRELIKHSVSKDAAKFKEVFGDTMKSIIINKIEKVRPEIAKNMFNEASGDKEAYQKFFAKKLKQFGVSSPDDLEGAEKKKFFDEVDAEWEADEEED